MVTLKELSQMHHGSWLKLTESVKISWWSRERGSWVETVEAGPITWDTAITILSEDLENEKRLERL